MKQTMLAALAALLALALVAQAQTARSASELLRMGRKAFNDGIHDVAERQLRALLLQFPKAGEVEEATLLVGETLVLSGQADAAVKWLTDAVAKYQAGKFAEAFLYWHGEALAAAGRWTEAEASYRAAGGRFFSTGKYRTQSQYGLGYALFGQKRFDEADEAFNVVVTHTGAPRDVLADALVMRGRIALARKQHEVADAQFETVATHYAGARAATAAHYWLAQSLREQGKGDAAAAAFDQALAPGKGPALPALMKGQAWLAIGEIRLAQQRWKDALAAFRQAFELAGSDAAGGEAAVAVKRTAALQLGDLGKRLGAGHDVIAHLRRFVDEHPREATTAPVSLRLAELLGSAKLHEETLAEYQRLLALFPKSPEAPNAMAGAAWTLLALGRKAEAGDMFAQITATVPPGPLVATAWFKIGDLALEGGNFPKAADAFQRAYETEPAGPAAADALWQLSLASERADRMDRRAAALEKMLAQFPKHAHADEAWLQLGQAYVAQKQYERAWQTFEKLWVGREPSPLATQARLAAAAARESSGQWRGAMTAYDELLALKPPPEVAAQAVFARAQCVAQSGDEAATRAAFEQVAREHPNAPVAAEAIFWLAQQQFNGKQWVEAQKFFMTVPEKWPAHRLADTAILWAARAAMNRQAYKEARDVLEGLLQNPAYRASPWRADARMLEAETLTEASKFAEALLVFESIARDFPDSPRADEAWGRVGDCHFSLGTEDPANPRLERYQQAVLAYQQVLNSLRANRAIKSQARYKIGKCFEKLGKRAEALERYLEIVYDADEQGRITAEPAWFCRAGLDAGELLETDGRWREAAKVYARLAQSGLAGAEGAKQRLQKIQTEHPELMQSGGR
ncbi:MAG: tetratricopeptide repeat protein [Verrucomicrobia bacterium]|nr:tetratricopeptide repeat protein [Verrucomicrobiota bacterium]